MSEDQLFRVASPRHRTEISEYLRSIAADLETGDEVTLSSEAESTTLVVPEEPRFEVEAERETDTSSGQTETSLDIEIEW